jgi:ABC-type lipoprotein export system ATPase subunit
MPLYRIEQASRSFGWRKRIQALPDTTAVIEEGSFTVIRGKTGSGKSTLLHVLAGLLPPDSGKVYLREKNLYPLGLGLRKVANSSFVFQDFQLLPNFDARTNILLPVLLRGHGLQQARQQLPGLMEELGLGHRQNHRPSQLSGGEQQRVAIARALITQPEIIFADEPTGNLDNDTEREILKLLKTKQKAGGFTLIVASHSSAIFRRASQIVDLSKNEEVRNQ